MIEVAFITISIPIGLNPAAVSGCGSNQIVKPSRLQTKRTMGNWNSPPPWRFSSTSYETSHLPMGWFIIHGANSIICHGFGRRRRVHLGRCARNHHLQSDGTVWTWGAQADGSVWMWGANDQGQCGNGTTNATWFPTRVSGLAARVGLPLKVIDSAQPGNIDLTWASATGEYFSIQYPTNLAVGFTDLLQSNPLATPPTHQVTLPMTGAQGYFRLKS